MPSSVITVTTEAQIWALIAIVLISLAVNAVLTCLLLTQTMRVEFRTALAEIRGMCRESAPGPGSGVTE